MNDRILSTRIAGDEALVRVRDRTRQVGDVFGLDNLQRTRLVTAVSEIARNAATYAGGGKIDFFFRRSAQGKGQAVIVTVSDSGPGIRHLDEILAGTFQVNGRTPLGMAGSRRLVDHFDVRSTVGEGTTVTLEMRLGSARAIIEQDQLASLAEQLVQRKAQTPLDELEQQNREMMLTLEELHLRKAELERADERKDEFLAMLAHELRNPLSAIGTAVELLKRKQDASAGDVQRLADLVGRQTNHLGRLVSDLLDVSRVTRGKIDLQRETIPVAELIEQALEMTQGVIAEKGHMVEYSPPSSGPWIYADRVRFRQILGNLLHNAARYTPDGGLIRITLSMHGDTVRIAVADNGVGMDADMLPTVFDLFVQADTGLARQDAGLGIGLTLVQRLLASHGGNVEVASGGLGMGSVFTVTMPTVAAHAPMPEVPAGVFVSHAGSLRILLIDDNADAVHTLRQLLEESGHQVAEAQTGQQGIAIAPVFCPQLVVIDIGLPDIDGFEVASALRHSGATAASTLVALSGYAAAEMRARGKEAGFDHYLVKPVDIRELEMLLDRTAT